MKTFRLNIFRAALVVAVITGLLLHNVWLPLAFLALTALLLARPTAALRVTLSVPELSQLVLESFKIQTPELFEPGGFALNVGSETAVLGDKITARIGIVPTPADYDPTPGKGFTNGVQDSTDLLEDVPVTLSFFKHVPIRIKWLSQLGSKINLSMALMEQGYALRKLVIDTALQTILPANFTYQKYADSGNINLDSMESIRSKMNTQKCSPSGRFCICNSAFAGSLASDQRIGPSILHTPGTVSTTEANPNNGYRRWKNIPGFENVYEYPDFPNAFDLQAYAGDQRGIIVSVRPINIAKVTPEMLGIPRIMSETPLVDEATKMPFIGVGWQDPGTGDLYTSIGLLFGVTAGNQGGGQDSITDRAGVRIVSQGGDV